jgi:hypothetical protein
LIGTKMPSGDIDMTDSHARYGIASTCRRPIRMA